MAQEAVEQKKAQSSKQRNKLLKIVAGVVVLVALVLAWNQFISSSDNSTVDTTIASTTTAGR